jgi:hypothetical protein
MNFGGVFGGESSALFQWSVPLFAGLENFFGQLFVLCKSIGVENR